VPSRSLNDGLRVVEAFIEPYITQALALTPSELEQKSSKSDTFVHALARFTRSRKVIRDQIMAILLAGRDTTASTRKLLRSSKACIGIARRYFENHDGLLDP
jgi:hypothetical protein